jgi:diguanylate cyclase (GGDEF)-like protein
MKTEDRQGNQLMTQRYFDMCSDKQASGVQSAMTGDTAHPLPARTRQLVFGLLYLLMAVVCTCNVMASATPPLQEVASKPGDTIVPRNIQFTRITPREGLSQAGVNAIAQDQYGMIWLGTQEGLNRYDGYEMVTYEHLPGEPDTLSHDWVWSVYLDAGGTMWVGTDGGGLNRYNRVEDTFTHFRHDPDNPLSISNDRVRVIYQDAQGTFWIGTDGGGLNRFDSDTGEFTRFHHVESEPDSLPGDTVLAIYEDSKGKLWIGTDNGLARMDHARKTFVSYRHDPSKPGSLSNDQVRSIYEDRRGQIWIGTYKGGLNIFDRSTDTFRHFQHDPANPHSLSHNRVRDIYQDKQGTLWVATDHGLNEWHPDKNGFSHYEHDPVDPSSISDNRLTTLFQDKGDVLWVGTFNGVNKWNYVSDAFKYLQVEPGSETQLSGNVITTIEESDSDVVWVGTYGDGMNRIDMATGSSTHYRHTQGDAHSLSDDRVMAIHSDKDNTIWVGTRNGGLDQLDPATGHFTHYTHDPDNPESMSSNSVTSIHSDDNGILWLGTYGDGLNRFDPAHGKFRVYRHDPADNTTLSSDRVLDIYRDGAGVLWVGTEDGGLNRFNEANGTFVRYAHDADNATSLGSDAAWNILESKDGALWVATMGGGLNHWNSSDRAADLPVFRKHLKTSGLRSDTVFGIVEDEDGFLWLSSNRGLSRFNPVDGNVRNFDRFNGLRGDEFNFGAYLQTSNGRMLFGGTDGIVSFHPDELLVNTHTPDIILTAHSRYQRLATSYSTEQWEPETITLGYDDDYIQFKFAALDFASSDKNQYRFKLEGFDEEWNDPGEFRRATYTSLPAGDYTFTVKASNNDGIWNDQGSSIKLHVEPPPWQTPFAYSIYTIFIGGTLGTYRRKKNKKLNEVSEQNEELESEVQARTQELSQSNDQLKSLNEELMHASVTDSLTGLKNRRFLDEFIDTEIARVHRRLEGAFTPEPDSNTVNISPSLFFMMIDLDGFKGINDTHGHLAGDKALVQVRDILQASCRESDTIIRWGGDEFLVIGNTASPRTAEQLAERIRANLADHQYQLGNGHVGRLSGSVGFSMYPFSPLDTRSLNWEQVVAVADHAAYAAKKNGRNAWVGVYGSEKANWEALTRTNINLPALARQGIVNIRSSLEKIEEFTENKAQEKA